MRLGTLGNDHGLVFPSGTGTPLSGGNLNCAFKAFLKRAGLSSVIRFHELLHTCVTLLLRQGVNSKFVQELLGHGDVSLTLNCYGHDLPDTGAALPLARWTTPWIRSRWCSGCCRNASVEVVSTLWSPLNGGP